MQFQTTLGDISSHCIEFGVANQGGSDNRLEHFGAVLTSFILLVNTARSRHHMAVRTVNIFLRNDFRLLQNQLALCHPVVSSS
jgi:hypothetical protein